MKLLFFFLALATSFALAQEPEEKPVVGVPAALDTLVAALKKAKENVVWPIPAPFEP